MRDEPAELTRGEDVTRLDHGRDDRVEVLGIGDAGDVVVEADDRGRVPDRHL